MPGGAGIPGTWRCATARTLPTAPLKLPPGSSARLGVYLMRGLLEAGRHVVTDNWCSSLRLAEYLLTKNTTVTGVVRAGRGQPKTLAAEKLQRHQSTFTRKGNTLVVKYQDKKEVNVLTPHYTANLENGPSTVSPCTSRGTMLSWGARTRPASSSNHIHMRKSPSLGSRNWESISFLESF